MQNTDIQIVKRCFCRNFESYNQEAAVQKQIAEKLGELISMFGQQKFDRVLEIGCGTGFLTREILHRFGVGEYFLNDIADFVFAETELLAFRQAQGTFRFIQGDAEKITFPGNFDAVFSASCFQWFHHFENFVSNIWNQMNPEGVLAFSSFGENNFREIKAITGVGLNYLIVSELIRLLSPCFEIIHAEEWLQYEYFQNPLAVLKHMKRTGVNGLKKDFFGKEKLQYFQDEYLKLHWSDGEKVRLTYHPIVVLARKKSRTIG